MFAKIDDDDRCWCGIRLGDIKKLTLPLSSTTTITRMIKRLEDQGILLTHIQEAYEFTGGRLKFFSIDEQALQSAIVRAKATHTSR